MNINYLIRRAALFLAIGSVMFLFSCNDDDDAVAAPEASFDLVQNGASITLTNTSTGEGNTYLWNFGDNTTSTETSPPKTYTVAGDFTVTLTATNEGGSSTATEDITITAAAVDTEAPVIQLNGDAEVSIEIGTDYVDPGATANDNVDGTITEVDVEGEVNSLVPGVYTLTYTVSDAAGNAATPVERTVTVTFDAGLLTNGDFENGSDPWFVNFGEGNPPPVPLVEEGGNTFFQVNIAEGNEDAASPFNVNLSQVVTLAQTNTYTLSFNAASDRERTIIAGIGLNGAAANNSETVTLAVGEARYTLTLEANTFGTVTGATESRVLFDLLGDWGVVVLDNISLTLAETGSGVAGNLPIDFEDGAKLTGVFDGNVGGEVIANPDPSGINQSSNVYAYTKGEGAAWFSGAFHLLPADLESDVISLKVWSPAAGVNFRVGLEIEGGAGFFYLEQQISAAQTWEEMTFDFSNSGVDLANGYNKLVIFPDWDAVAQAAPTETAIYYYDDITAGGGDCPAPTGGELATNGDFESGEGCGWLTFPNGGTAEFDNSVNNGGSASGRLLAAGTATSGANPGLKQERFGAGTVQAGDVVQVQFDITGEVAGAGGVFNVILFGEGAAGVSFTQVLTAPTLGSTFTQYTATHTIPGDADVTDGLSLLIEAVCGAVEGCSVGANIDNVSVTLNP